MLRTPSLWRWLALLPSAALGFWGSSPPIITMMVDCDQGPSSRASQGLLLPQEQLCALMRNQSAALEVLADVRLKEAPAGPVTFGAWQWAFFGLVTGSLSLRVCNTISHRISSTLFPELHHTEAERAYTDRLANITRLVMIAQGMAMFLYQATHGEGLRALCLAPFLLYGIALKPGRRELTQMIELLVFVVGPLQLCIVQSGALAREPTHAAAFRITFPIYGAALYQRVGQFGLTTLFFALEYGIAIAWRPDAGALYWGLFQSLMVCVFIYVTKNAEIQKANPTNIALLDLKFMSCVLVPAGVALVVFRIILDEAAFTQDSRKMWMLITACTVQAAFVCRFPPAWVCAHLDQLDIENHPEILERMAELARNVLQLFGPAVIVYMILCGDPLNRIAPTTLSLIVANAIAMTKNNYRALVLTRYSNPVLRMSIMLVYTRGQMDLEQIQSYLWFPCFMIPFSGALLHVCFRQHLFETLCICGLVFHYGTNTMRGAGVGMTAFSLLTYYIKLHLIQVKLHNTPSIVSTPPVIAPDGGRRSSGTGETTTQSIASHIQASIATT